MPSSDVGSEVFRNFALNCWPWVRSLIHSPDAVIHSPDCSVPDHRNQFPVPTSLDSQHAKAGVIVVKCHALDRARQNFLGRWLRWRFHLNGHVVLHAAKSSPSRSISRFGGYDTRVSAHIGGWPRGRLRAQRTRLGHELALSVRWYFFE
jgi:hypothetical protein